MTVAVMVGLGDLVGVTVVSHLVGVILALGITVIGGRVGVTDTVELDRPKGVHPVIIKTKSEITARDIMGQIKAI